MAMHCSSRFFPKLYTALISYSSFFCHTKCLSSLVENGSSTFLSSSGNPCLDFFFHVVPNTPPETLTRRLDLAWEHDPLKALKLVCNLLGVKGTGKSDMEGGCTAALWLHKNHPKTLACNVDSFADFGYPKDLLEILFRLGKLSLKRDVDRYNSDPDFKFLHDCVSDYFARCLRSDMKTMASGDHSNKISLAAKCFPSLRSSYVQNPLLFETIAKKVFPREEYPEYELYDTADRAMFRLMDKVIDPLRKALELPEVYMADDDCGSIPYHRVVSDDMSLYMHKFLDHDGERFKEYIENVKTGKAEISASGALLPHEIRDYSGNIRNELECIKTVSELQWKRMVGDMAKKRKLSNCLAICGGSRNMYGDPWSVAVELGVLVSDLSRKPWKGRLITFNDKNPLLQKVRGPSLVEKTNFVKKVKFGTESDFQKVIDMLLQVAVDGKLKPEQMIKRLFVFSDMEFKKASENSCETDYEAIVRKFREKGYGECVPEIVFWKLSDSEATLVRANQPGVALVSGFSNNLLTLFLDEGGILNPEAVMEAAISGDMYEKLQVYD